MPELDARLITALRADLESAGFTVAGLESAWGPVAASALGRDDRVAALAALDRSEPTALGTLGRLFVLGVPVPAADLSEALRALGLDGARALGLVALDGDDVRALIDLRPYAVADDAGVSSWWIASDPGDSARGGELPPDHVLGAGAASTTLAGVLVPTGSGTVLDLGTGSGVQALQAARTASRVVGTDVSARALEFARFTALLNGVGFETRLGSLYEPVEGERFDRIVSNPPFVITPRAAADVPGWEYRDAGLVGDAVVERIMRGAADHLNPGGIAQLLGNWELRAGEDPARRVLGWAAQTGLDAWVVQRDRLDPAEYAETWVRDGGARAGTRRWEQLVRVWLDDFAERGVTAIGAGHITLRRPDADGPTLARFEELTAPLGGDAGAAIARGLAAHDLQRALDDDALADRRLRVAPDVTEHRHHWPGAADPAVIELVQGGGFARRRAVGTEVAAVVGACDGELALGAISDAVAALLETDAAATRREVLPVVRELLVEGFLTTA